MAKTNSKKSTTNRKTKRGGASSGAAIDKIEGAIKHKEIQIAKAERAIKKWEDFEERIELKELHKSINDIEDIVQYPSQQLNNLASHLIKEYKNRIGLASSKPRKNRLQDLFEVALWGKGPTENASKDLKKQLGYDANSSVYQIFSSAQIGKLTNKETFSSTGIKNDSDVRRAILDWELAIEKYEGVSEGASNVLKADISKLIHGEDVHFHKNKNQYDDVPQYVLYYSNANQLSDGLRKYCLAMQKNATQLTKAFNNFSKTLIGQWNSNPLDEATLINDDTKLSSSLWLQVNKMVNDLKKK